LVCVERIREVINKDSEDLNAKNGIKEKLEYN